MWIQASADRIGRRLKGGSPVFWFWVLLASFGCFYFGLFLSVGISRMKIICCKCHRDLGEKEPLEDESITSPFCMKCFKEELAEIDREAAAAGLS
jgi:hypothetical protein